MSLILKASDLRSRAIRANLIAGKSGSDLLGKAADLKKSIRKIGSLTQLQKPDDNSPLGKAIRFFQAGASFVGWAVKGVFSLFGLVDVSAIWSMIVQTTTFLFNFDWNASEDELAAMAGDAETALGAAWGLVFGTATGWIVGLAIGVGVAIKIPVIGGAALAKAVSKAVKEEALQEFSAQLGGAIRTTIVVAAKQAFISGYINLRNWVKSAPQSQLEGIFGKQNADFIKNKWGNKGGPTYSMAKTLEEKVEKIPSKFWKAFLQTGLEQAWESFVESGFIVANEIDYALQQHKLANQQQLGETRTISIKPDATIDDEKLMFTGVPQNLLMPAVQQTLNTHRMVKNRDLGMLVGQPLNEYAKANPQTLRLVIKFYSKQKPPYPMAKGKRVKEATYTIPDAKRSAVTWEQIKLACGGANGYMWGRFRAYANLDNQRTMAVYGATEKEALERLRAFMALSSAKVLSMAVTEELKEGRRSEEKLNKEPTRMYPAFFTVINREEILERDKGRASLKQNYIDRNGRILLYPDTEPKTAKDTIERLFRKGT